MRQLLLAGVSLTVLAGGLVLGPAAPAHASTVASGYVWANQPTAASYLANSGYEYSSTGGDIELTRSGVGRYRVRFLGMSTSGGVAQVRPYGTNNRGICTVTSWSHGIDVSVNVRCFDTTGAPADSMFVAHFTSLRPDGNFAYFWAHLSSAAGAYEPTATYAYDSTGVASSVERLGTGRYVVYLNALSALYPDAHNDGHMQVTAYNSSAVHCGMRVGADENPPPLVVYCYNAVGALIDSRFVVSYSYAVSPLATAPRGNAYVRNNAVTPPYIDGWWSAGGQPSVLAVTTGRYRVRFPLLATAAGYAIVHTQEVNGDYCAVGSWYPDGATLEQVINVSCYDGVTHLPRDQDFSVAFTN